MRDYYVLGGWDGMSEDGMMAFFRRIPWGYLPFTIMDFHPFEGRAFYLKYLQKESRSIYNQINSDHHQDVNYKLVNYSIYTSQENNWLFNDFYRGSFDLLTDLVDLSLGQYKPQAVVSTYANYFHFPVYIVNLFNKFGIVTVNELKQHLAELEQGKVKSASERNLLFCQIARHDQLLGVTGVRARLVKAIEDTFTNLLVACPGQFRHNTNELWEKFNNEKIPYLQQFVFNLCPENSYAPGYVTEKIWDSIRAGCIPIYWGGIETDLDIFNPQAILFFDPRKPSELTTKLRQFFSDASYQQQLCSQSYFLPGAAERIWLRYFYPLLKRFSEDLGLDNIYQFRCQYKSQTQEFILEDCTNSLEQEYALATANLAALGLNETRYAHLTTHQYRYPFTQQQRYQLVGWQIRSNQYWQHILQMFANSLKVDEQGNWLIGHKDIALILRTRYQIPYYEQLRLRNKDFGAFPVQIPNLGFKFSLVGEQLEVNLKETNLDLPQRVDNLVKYLTEEKYISQFNERIGQLLAERLERETQIWSQELAQQIKNPLLTKYPELLLVNKWYQAKQEHAEQTPEVERLELVTLAEAEASFTLAQAIEKQELSIAELQQQLTASYPEVTTTINPAAEPTVEEDDLYGYLYMDKEPQVVYGVPKSQ